MHSEEKRENCWNRIGVWGQEEPRCPRLPKVIHCRNCEVFTRAGRDLLEREMPENYREEWVQVFVDKKEEELPGTTPLIIFRLTNQWFGLPAQLLEEVISPQPFHTVPHRESPILLGIVNVHGEIQLCISLQHLLELGEGAKSAEPPAEEAHKVYQRMIVINRDNNRWVFPVDEVLGMHRVDAQTFENVPVTVAKAKKTFAKHLFKWEDITVALLDDELLLYRLTRSVR
jgi:chemotaxis-related protein WspD